MWDSLACQLTDKPTVIMDAGIATEDNLAALRERGFHWITVKRGGVKPDQVEAMKTQDPDATFETKSGHEVRAWRLSHDHENERHCASGARPVRRRMRPFWRRSVNLDSAVGAERNSSKMLM